MKSLSMPLFFQVTKSNSHSSNVRLNELDTHNKNAKSWENLSIPISYTHTHTHKKEWIDLGRICQFLFLENKNKAVLGPQVSPAFAITYFCNHSNIRFDPIPVQWYVRIYRRIIMYKSHYWPFFKNFSQKVNNPKWPLDDLWPRICWCPMCDST